VYIIGETASRGLRGSARRVEERCVGINREILFPPGGGAMSVDERLGPSAGKAKRRDDVALRDTELGTGG
jgi:hypothetical protein